MGVNDLPWLKANPNRVQLRGPVCVAYGHPDLDKTHQYLIDFGFVEAFRENSGASETIYYRGYGVQPVVYIAKRTPTPEFLGIYFEAASHEDLERATRLSGAGEIKNFVAGAKEVEITDPTGMPFHVVFGLEKRPFTPPDVTKFEPPNYPAATDRDVAAKPRRGKFHRPEKGIVPIHKLGHCGYITADLDECCDFYTTNFNFKPSDIMVIPGEERFALMMFMHVDLGKEYSDHHSFFLVRGMGPLVPGTPHHAAFEVTNIDSQFIGHEYLEGKGYKPFWGVGRHVEGSQVFDYWFDLDGFVLEHYADGDLVNEDHEVGWVEAKTGPDGNNWGPPFPLLEDEDDEDDEDKDSEQPKPRL